VSTPPHYLVPQTIYLASEPALKSVDLAPQEILSAPVGFSPLLSCDAPRQILGLPIVDVTKKVISLLAHGQPPKVASRFRIARIRQGPTPPQAPKDSFHRLAEARVRPAAVRLGRSSG